MKQNRETGEAGRKFGLACGPRVAELLGARPLGGPSNECLWQGERVVVKCARGSNDTVGVLLGMLERIDAVVGVFEVGIDRFVILRMSVADYRAHMRERYRENAAPQGMMSRSKFLKIGQHIQEIELRLDEPDER
ncbi:MAG TPA: hypothetical protein VGB92_18575 [Longimicrobium sp.]|jgi:hypothetical protein